MSDNQDKEVQVPKELDLKNLKKLRETLHHSEVAIRLALSYIQSTNSALAEDAQKFNIDNYLELYEKDKSKIPILADRATPQDKAVSVVVQLSIETISKKERIGTAAKDMCLLSAYLMPDEYSPLKIYEDTDNPNWQPIDMATIDTLTSYALGQYRASDHTYRCDAAVSQAIRANFKASEEAIIDKGLKFILKHKIDMSLLPNALCLHMHSMGHVNLMRKYSNMPLNTSDEIREKCDSQPESFWEVYDRQWASWTGEEDSDNAT